MIYLIEYKSSYAGISENSYFRRILPLFPPRKNPVKPTHQPLDTLISNCIYYTYVPCNVE